MLYLPSSNGSASASAALHPTFRLSVKATDIVLSDINKDLCSSCSLSDAALWE